MGKKNVTRHTEHERAASRGHDGHRCHNKARTTENKWELTEEVRRRVEEIAERPVGLRREARR